LDEGLVYLQVTRGTSDRDFVFDEPNSSHGMVLFTQSKALVENPMATRGQNIKIVEDLRWGRADIKTVQLLYPSLMKTRAKRSGADDVWLQRDGVITEGSSNNAYIVTKSGEIITRDLSTDILHGITREAVLKCARKLQMKVVERAFSVLEIGDAIEAFSTSASGFVNPVVKVDDTLIGDGTPGPVAKSLRGFYIKESLETAI
jgi:D-alanine transaminase